MKKILSAFVALAFLAVTAPAFAEEPSAGAPAAETAKPAKKEKKASKKSKKSKKAAAKKAEEPAK